MRSSPAILALVAATCAVVVGSCGPRTKVTHPTFPGGGLLAGSTPPAPGSLRHFEALVQPSTRFGGHALVHATETTLSIFGEANATYAVLGAGCIDGGARLVLEGAWRDPSATDTGLVRLFAGPSELVAIACSGADAASLPTPRPRPSFDGAIGSGSALPADPLALAFERERVDLRGKFRAAAHHGSCSTIDDCGWSENTVESIRNVEPMGGNVVEIDVRVSKDGVPFVFHDEEFGPRLTAGEFCHGQVADFTLAEVRALCTAKYGETIPTLAEALDAIIDETRLADAWIDVKTPSALAPTIDVVRAKNAIVAAKKRGITIVVGLPDTETIDTYKALPHDDITCLCELDPQDVRDLGCAVWAPRWTRGPLAADVAAMQSEGKKVVYWTIDEVDFLDRFLTEGRPDGVLSDHPGLVMERVQMLHLVAP